MDNKNLRALANVGCGGVPETSAYCVQQMGAEGQGSDMLLVPSDAFYSWLVACGSLGVDAASPTVTPFVITTGTAFKNVPNLTYDTPKGFTTPTTIDKYLFPVQTTVGYVKEGIFFNAINQSFQPKNGTKVTAQGVIFESVAMEMAIPSTFATLDLIKYLMRGTWTIVKKSADGSALHIYGGRQGVVPQVDSEVMMNFSGNDDTGGTTTLVFSRPIGSNLVMELRKGSAADTKQNAISELFDLMATNFCMPQSTDFKPYSVQNAPAPQIKK